MNMTQLCKLMIVAGLYKVSEIGETQTNYAKRRDRYETKKTEQLRTDGLKHHIERDILAPLRRSE